MRLILLLLSCMMITGAWWHRVSLNGTNVLASSYQGPGDIVSGATAWYGLRAYTAAIAAAGTQKLVNVRRTSDSETCDLLVATSGGMGLTANCSGADNGKTAATWLTSTTGFVTKWYDQSGHALDMAQATNGNQPQLLLSGCTSGSFPCLKFVAASSQYLTSTAFSPVSQPYSFSVVANYNSGSCGAAQCELIASNGSGGLPFEFQTGISYVYAGGGAALTQTAVATTWHAISTVWHDSTSATDLDVDGSTATGLIGTLASGSTVDIGALPGTSRFLDGDMAEAGMWPSDITSSQSALNTQQHSYWGF